MINLITFSDFKNPYFVFGSGTEHEAFLNELISEFQEDILKQILGFRLYDEMDADISVQFWDRFINGYKYTYQSIDYDYKGIKKVLTKMLYYWWHENKSSTLISGGALQMDFKEGKKVIPVRNMLKNYNDAVELIQSSKLYASTVYHYLDTQYSGDLWNFEEFEKLNLLGI